MLTHEELMEECQELRQAMDIFEYDMRMNGYVYNPNLNAHEQNLGRLIDREEYLLSLYLENRDSISDEDAEEIIMLIAEAYFDMGFATGSICTEENTPNDLMTNNN